MSSRDERRRLTDEADAAMVELLQKPTTGGRRIKAGGRRIKARAQESPVLELHSRTAQSLSSVPSISAEPFPGRERSEEETSGPETPEAHALRLGYYPNKLMQAPAVLPTEEYDGESHSYQAVPSKDATDVVVILANPGNVLRVGPRAGATLFALCTYYKLVAVDQRYMSSARLDGEWMEVDAADLHRDLGRSERKRGYDRTVEDLTALMLTGYARSWEYHAWDEGQRRYVLRREAWGGTLLNEYRFAWSDERQRYVFRFRLGDWLRELLAAEPVGIIDFGLFRELRSDYAIAMVPWLRSVTWLPSTQGKWQHSIALARLWELFPLAAERPAPVFYRRVVERALADLCRVGFLREPEWTGRGWDQRLTIRFDPQSPHVRRQP